METKKATPEEKLFFEKLLDLKAYVKQKLEEKYDKTLEEIYKRLNETIKEKSEK